MEGAAELGVSKTKSSPGDDLGAIPFDLLEAPGVGGQLEQCGDPLLSAPRLLLLDAPSL